MHAAGPLAGTGGHLPPFPRGLCVGLGCGGLPAAFSGGEGVWGEEKGCFPKTWGCGKGGVSPETALECGNFWSSFGCNKNIVN